jgi:glycosyltransferase involved in cell wall biosynthesis
MEVSVIIPTCNRPSFLDEAIGSVLSCVREGSLVPEGLEVVIVDDGDDGSAATVASKYEHDERAVLRSIKSRKPFSGPSRARNAGVEASEGQFLYFLDDDDLFRKNRFTRSLELLRSGSIDVVLERTLRIDTLSSREPFETGPEPDIQLSAFEYLLVGGEKSHVTPAATSFTRAAFTEVGGYDKTLRYGEDGELLLRLCLMCSVSLVSGEAVAIYRTHGDNSSGFDRLATWQNIKSLRALYKKMDVRDYAAEKRFVKHQLQGKLDFALTVARLNSTDLRDRFGAGFRCIANFPIECLSVGNLRSIAVWLFNPGKVPE